MRSWERLAEAAAGCATALALGAAGALAASVQVHEQHPTKAAPIYTAEFVAEGGERNDVTVTAGSGGGVTFADSGAVVLAKRGCTQVDAQRAHCSRGAPVAKLGDLDDHARSLTSGAVFGGPGDDELEGAGGLYGEAGADVIRNDGNGAQMSGGDGSDRVLAGGGGDTISESEDGEPDLLDGGAGHDQVAYPSSLHAVVDLSTGRGGADDDDTLRGIESASAGGGTLQGDAGANVLVTTTRPSTLRGGAGPDDLIAYSERRDRMDGGPGDDVLNVGKSPFEYLPARDSIRCGPGLDVVSDPAPNTVVPVDCEEVDFSGENGPDVVLRRTGTGAALATLRWDGACAPEYGSGGCRVEAEVSEAFWPDRSKRPLSGRVLGLERGLLDRRSGRRRLAVHPGRHGRAVLASGRCVIARLKITGTGRNASVETLVQFGRRCRATPPIAP